MINTGAENQSIVHQGHHGTVTNAHTAAHRMPLSGHKLNFTPVYVHMLQWNTPSAATSK
jgi:hypothetical protein